ncbi:MAG: NADH-quinone oxidoreductase subunit N [Gammaproteobacteria bacterium]|nr:NADH-quinone oxidoreductase subunit N [Gammaproteobacteria bacterium]
MTLTDLWVSFPLVVLVGGTLVLMIGVSIVRTHKLALGLTLLTLILSLAAHDIALDHIPEGGYELLGLLHVSGVQVFFNALFLLGAIVTALFAYPYFDARVERCEEFYILLLTATAGAMVVAAATHFASFVLGLEILSISLYALIAYPRQSHAPLEAAAKYLVLSAVASSAILMGMALIYVASGTMAFAEITLSPESGERSYFLLGQALICVGIAFKLSLVPFHMWTPDVYQGAPAVVTGYVATVSKGAVIALLITYVQATEVLSYDGVFYAVVFVAVASMIVGNLLALLQTNVKRLLAYSSIAHLGYLLIAVLVVNSARPELVLETILLYMAAYFIITLAAFGIVNLTSEHETEDNEKLEAYTGLFWRNPLLASILTVVALALAGIPLTIGFIAKFYVFAAGVEGTAWALIWALLIGSAIGVFYYLRLIYTMVKEVQPGATALPRIGNQSVVAVTVLGLLIVVLGVYPTPMIDMIRSIVQASGF